MLHGNNNAREGFTLSRLETASNPGVRELNRGQYIGSVGNAEQGMTAIPDNVDYVGEIIRNVQYCQRDSP